MRSIILVLFLFVFGSSQVGGASHTFAAESPEAGARFAEPMVQPMPEPPQEPPLLEGEVAPVLAGEMPMRTYSIDFYRLPGGLTAETIQAIAMPIEETIMVGAEKMGNRLQGRVSIRFEPPQTGPCAIRGLTLSNDRTMRLFYEPEVDTNRVIAIMAHEFIHQLQHDYYGVPDHLQSDNILLEGMAVWASSAYFVDAEGRPLYHVRARQALVDGTLLPLATDLVADCRTTTRVNIYDQWGSFVEYLINTYGREQFDAVYRDSTGRAAGSANYQGVYGKSLEQLEAEWIEWLWNTP
ncbi:MAG: hypothetical protein AAGF95_21030 [Chloroflexota bacterium]